MLRRVTADRGSVLDALSAGGRLDNGSDVFRAHSDVRKKRSWDGGYRWILFVISFIPGVPEI